MLFLTLTLALGLMGWTGRFPDLLWYVLQDAVRSNLICPRTGAAHPSELVLGGFEAVSIIAIAKHCLDRCYVLCDELSSRLTSCRKQLSLSRFHPPNHPLCQPRPKPDPYAPARPAGRILARRPGGRA